MGRHMGQMDGPMKGMVHDSTPPAGGDTTRGRRGMDPSKADTAEGVGAAHMSRMMELHMRMMADPIIRQRVMADSGTRRLMREMMAEMPAEHREQMRVMMGDGAEKQARPRRRAAPVPKAEPKDSVVLFNTGGALKYLDVISHRR